jgi:hypothetical protein
LYPLRRSLPPRKNTRGGRSRLGVTGVRGSGERPTVRRPHVADLAPLSHTTLFSFLFNPRLVPLLRSPGLRLLWFPTAGFGVDRDGLILPVGRGDPCACRDCVLSLPSSHVAVVPVPWVASTETKNRYDNAVLSFVYQLLLTLT